MRDFNINGHLEPLELDDVHHTNYADYLPTEINKLLEDSDMNAYNRCGVIVRSFDEMYWQGCECEHTNEILGGWDAVCDNCFSELSEN